MTDFSGPISKIFDYGFVYRYSFNLGSSTWSPPPRLISVVCGPTPSRHVALDISTQSRLQRAGMQSHDALMRCCNCVRRCRVVAPCAPCARPQSRTATPMDGRPPSGMAMARAARACACGPRNFDGTPCTRRHGLVRRPIYSHATPPCPPGRSQRASGRVPFTAHCQAPKPAASGRLPAGSASGGSEPKRAVGARMASGTSRSRLRVSSWPIEAYVSAASGIRSTGVDVGVIGVPKRDARDETVGQQCWRRWSTCRGNWGRHRAVNRAIGIAIGRSITWAARLIEDRSGGS